MLAGYLPFDDDPANPEGDNINLLYKYIVTTPLTFPEYVTPHARDLLRRILVPDPRKRADLFEVARHSWLSEYAKVVEHITSGATTVEDISNATVPAGMSPLMYRMHVYLKLTPCAEGPYAVPTLGRSASVREPSRAQPPASSGGLSTKHAPQIDPNEMSSRQRDDKHKRATLQVEYVQPNTSTTRGEASPPTALPPPQSSPSAPGSASQSKTRARGDSMGGPVEVASQYQSPTSSSRQQQQRPSTQSSMPPPSRPGRDPARSVSESTALNMNPPNAGRPATAGAMDRVTGSRLPSRGNSYGQPISPTVAATNAEGRFSQPKNSGYIIQGAIPEGDRTKRDSWTGRPVSQQLPDNFQARQEDRQENRAERPSRGHKRSNTVESFTNKIFGRTNSRRESTGPEGAVRPEKPSRAYPPLSMKNALPNDPESVPRPSTEARRQSFGFNRKSSDVGGPTQQRRESRRFSFLPASFSRMSFSGASKDPAHESASGSRRASLAPAPPPGSRHGSREPKGMAFGQGRSRSPSQSTTGSNIPVLYDSSIDNRQQQRRMPQQQPVRGATAPDLSNLQDSGIAQQPYSQTQQGRQHYGQQGYNYTPPSSSGQQQSRPEEFYTPSQSLESQQLSEPAGQQQGRTLYPPGFNDSEYAQSKPAPRQQAVLQKNRKFGDQYENGSGSSSGGARRVMDWFRKRGKDRSG